METKNVDFDDFFFSLVCFGFLSWLLTENDIMEGKWQLTPFVTAPEFWQNFEDAYALPSQSEGISKMCQWWLEQKRCSSSSSGFFPWRSSLCCATQLNFPIFTCFILHPPNIRMNSYHHAQFLLSIPPILLLLLVEDCPYQMIGRQCRHRLIVQGDGLQIVFLSGIVSASHLFIVCKYLFYI